MVNQSKVTECESQISAVDMIKNMMNAQETLASTNAGTSDIAASHGDKLTEDLALKGPGPRKIRMDADHISNNQQNI